MTKYIITEGEIDKLIIQTLFSERIKPEISIIVANGFSNVVGVYVTLFDHGFDVVAILDTDTNHPGVDNRKITERLIDTPIIGRKFNVIWMDPNIEGEISRVLPFRKQGSSRNTKNIILNNKDKLLELEVFKKISLFIG